jgi:hypothetical protein
MEAQEKRSRIYILLVIVGILVVLGIFLIIAISLGDAGNETGDPTNDKNSMRLVG